MTAPRPLAAAVLAGAGACWLLLVAAHEAPYARWLGHHSLGDEGPSPFGLAVFLAGWSAMIVATLLPTTLPLLDVVRRVGASLPRPGLLTAAVCAGFVAVWAAFGYAAWVGDTFVHAVVDSVPWLAARPEAILAATLAGAGAYQLSPVKRRCLTMCRSPRALVLQHWGAPAPAWRRAARVGIAHGRACLGCCWPLMLVMFAVGLGSLAWMVVLAVVMGVEKQAPRGELLTRPLGVALLAAGALVAIA